MDARASAENLHPNLPGARNRKSRPPLSAVLRCQFRIRERAWHTLKGNVSLQGLFQFSQKFKNKTRDDATLKLGHWIDRFTLIICCAAHCNIKWEQCRFIVR